MAGSFHQLGYVTNAIDAACERFRVLQGIGSFRAGERHLETLEYGVAGRSVIRTALANHAGIQIEIVQPIDGQLAVFGDVAGRDGFQLMLQHVAYRIEGSIGDWLGHLEALRAAGRPLAWQSKPSPISAFAYTDDRTTLGHYVEHLWSTPERWAEMMRSVPTG